MNMKIESVERFIYFIVSQSRNYSYVLKNLHPLTKLKHYIYMSKYVAKKFEFSITKNSIVSQVMIAQDPEWSHAFKNHYVYNLWNYYFESSVQLDSDAASIETEIDQPSVNVLNDYSLTNPTVADVEDEMLEAFKDDYLEFSLKDTSEEGQLQGPCQVIMLPEDDRMVIRLNEVTDEDTGELYMDTLSDDDQIEHVSNDNIGAIMSKEFNSMLQDLLPESDNLIEDMKSFDKDETIREHYIPMLEKMDLFTYLNMEDKENE